MDKTKGIIFGVLSSIAFGFMPIFAKIAYNNGSNATSVLSCRFILAASIIFVVGKILKVSFKITKDALKLLILIGVILYPITTETLFLSYNYMSVGIATTIHFIYPSVVTIISIFILKQKVSKHKIIALLLSTVGVYFLVGFGIKGISIKGVVLAVISGISYGISIILMRNRHVRNLDSLVMTFYFSIFAGMTVFMIGGLSSNINYTINTNIIFSFIGISLVSTILATVFFIKSVKLLNAETTAILGTFEPIFSIFLGIIFFNEKITLIMVLGMVLILVSVFYLATESECKSSKVQESTSFERVSTNKE